MSVVTKIKEYLRKQRIEEMEEQERQQELVEKVKYIRNINIFNVKKTEKISVINRINIYNMNKEQLKNTYLFIKKSIYDAEQKEDNNEIFRLKQLKQETKKLLLEKSKNMDLNSIKNQVLFGDINKLDYYRNYLLVCYQEYKNIKTNDAQQKRITILTILRLIELKKEKTESYQFVKKVA